MIKKVKTAFIALRKRRVHILLTLIASGLAVAAPTLINQLPELIGEGAAHVPYLTQFAPLIATAATALAAHYTPLVKSYGKFADPMSAVKVAWENDDPSAFVDALKAAGVAIVVESEAGGTIIDPVVRADGSSGA